MNDFTVSDLKIGRPTVGLTLKEIDCYNLLDSLDISYERVDFNGLPNKEDDFIEIDNKIGVSGTKNLVFQNRNKSSGYLLMVRKDKRINKKAFANIYSTSRIAMVEGAELEELLNTHSGAVSVTNLMYDKNFKVTFYVDQDILNCEYVRFHPNENRALVRIKTEDFINKLMPKLGYSINILDNSVFENIVV